MTDTDRMLECLERAGFHGVHSHDLRRWAITGNPSQRAADLEAKGYEIERERENKGKRPGTRYRLVGVGAGSKRDCGVDRSQNSTPSADSGESLSLFPETPYERMQDAA